MNVGRSAALAASALALSAAARAAETEDVLLRYEALAGCPERARFEAEVQALSRRVQFVEAAAGAREFRVRFERKADGVEGTLQISAETGQSERKVSGKSCNEVASALALATAIAVDPSVLGESTAPEPATSPEQKREAGPPAKVRDAAADRGRSDRVPAPGPSKTGNAMIGVGAGVETAIAPGAPVRFAVRLGWHPPDRWAPVPFVEGAYLLPVTTEFVEFSSMFALRGGASLRLFESPPWSAGPELSFEVGSVKASGNDRVLANARAEQRLWVAGELAAYARWHATAAFFVELSAGALVPVLRRDYVYRPISPVAEPVVAHSIPSVGFATIGRIALFL
jgi:hypothetical protein